MSRTRRGRHRRRSRSTAEARAVGLPALIALTGALVVTVPNVAFAERVPVGGVPPTRACQDSSSSGSSSPSDSATATAGATATATASPGDSGTGLPTSTATSASPVSSPCGAVRADSPTATATLSKSPSGVATTPRPSSPSGSTTPTRSSGPTPGAGSSGSEGTEPTDGPQNPYGPITRAQIMQRALAWVEQRVPYSQTAWWVDEEGSYRQDCSGYVSMAWGLDQAIDFWTGNLNTVSFPVEAAQLLPGDILLSATHTVLFAGWADGAHTEFDFYEESHPGTVAHYVTGASVAAYLNAGFVPYRYDGIVGPNAGTYVTPTAGTPITALGPLAQELAPEGTDVRQPAPGPGQTQPTPARTAAAVRAADLEPAAAELPDEEAGSVGVAVGGSVLLFTGLSLALTRRRALRAGGGRPPRRH